MSKPTEESFLKDVEHHKITVVRDEGNHRHVIFAKPGTYCMRFELITWPGFLCYTGDMGTFVFRRLDDMFSFFRDERPETGHLRINLGYWAEKVEAADRCDGTQCWSEDKFRAVIEHYLENDGEPVSAELREAVEEEVLSNLGDGEHEAYRAASQFNHNGFQFNDLWDHDFKEYTYRFVWCCYALAWGIKQYDLATSKQEVSG
jgi:hypothetical protein